MKLILIVLFFLILSAPVEAQMVTAPYPQPPSDEQKAEWKRLGDENLRKYGDGSGGGQAPIQPVLPTFTPTPSLTNTPTPTPTAISTPTPTNTPVQNFQIGVPSFFSSILKALGF